MDRLEKQMDYLKELVTTERLALLTNKLALRTRYITVCLEDLYQPQNISAVLRSCEAFGVQDIHVVENNNHSRIYPDICLGTDKWLNIYKYTNRELIVDDNNLHRKKKRIILDSAPIITDTSKEGSEVNRLAIASLRKAGYRIVATAPDSERGVSLNDFDIAKGPFALIYGTERTGLSPYMMEEADEFLYLPMVGFVESLNVSVSAAIMLHSLTTKLRQSSLEWKLPHSASEKIMFKWLMMSVRSSDEMLRRFNEIHNFI